MIYNTDISFAITHSDFKFTETNQFPPRASQQWITTFIKTVLTATKQGDFE
jgi:hypothetical protein